jgi:hypothetical protein
MNVGEQNDLPPQHDRDHDENENAPSIMVDSSAAENKPLTGRLDDATAGEWARQGTVKRKQATIMVFGMLGQDLDNRKKFSQSEMEIKRKRGIEEMPGYIATLRSDWAQPVNPEITRILLRVLREDIHRDLKIGDKHGWFPIGDVMSYLSGLKDERYSFARVGLNVLRSAVAHEEYASGQRPAPDARRSFWRYHTHKSN